MSRPTASTPRRLLWSRWLVLALLSLTLPLQGALAATMAIGMALMAPAASAGSVVTMPTHCEEMVMADMSGMAGIEAATAAAATPDMPAMTTMDGMSGMDATDHGRPSAPDITHHAGHATGMDHGDDPSSSDHHCGICLQCCIGAAIPVAPLIVAAQDLRDAPPTLGAIGAPEQLPQSLDRPPKPLLA
ncbi:MAG: hypothetical protein J7598_09935 [Mitsuaria chitosanitabida]|uniref:hypothetical protein n=1 Tax=Roseateles chitosanitabidus TaxID=65048 RepID=UPI001B2B88E8|nr:hypothetical protein [Roseateles chitosanitabidus]MBO9686921.1 hypothetical protein [Roseateles chitosanitabidus]